MNQKIQDFSCKISKKNILFFDFDGTLVDTNYANYLSYIEAIKFVTVHDVNITYNPKVRLTSESLIKILPKRTKTEYETIVQLKEKIYSNHLSDTKLKKHTVNILMRYFESNRTVLVTNGKKERVFLVLEYHGITKSFSNIFCREFKNGEKFKTKYECAITDLKIEPSKIIAFENEKIEINHALSAGILEKNIWSI